MRAQGTGLPQGLVGTPERLSALRGTCLVRDRHRCVISGKFDASEAATRIENHDQGARDDDGHLLVDEVNGFDVLEVAHILPHALTKATRGSELVSYRGFNSRCPMRNLTCCLTTRAPREKRHLLS